jgi:hypothetical protein
MSVCARQYEVRIDWYQGRDKQRYGNSPTEAAAAEEIKPAAKMHEMMHR